MGLISRVSSRTYRDSYIENMVSEATMESIEFLIGEQIKPSELKLHEEKYRTRSVLRNAKQPLSKDDELIFFQYALALTQSPYRSDWPRGRTLLEKIYTESNDAV